MNDTIVKNALSYSLGSDLHEAWRAPRKLGDGTYEPRLKKSKDEEWNAKHGTDEVDIANCSFEQLPSNWQYENLEAARVAIELVYDKTVAGEILMEEDIEKMASVIHDEWLKRNDWVFNPEYGDSKLAVPYAQLSREEQEKDIAQLAPAQAKVIAFLKGSLDIEQICEQYNLPKVPKVL